MPRRAATESQLPFLPSGRSLLVGFALLGLAVACYLAARETSLFAVQQVEVTGARPYVIRQVDEALAPLEGKSLLAVDDAAIQERLRGLPDVTLVSYDRAFPHKARIIVTAERPVAVLRRGPESWLVSERGRILRHLPDPSGWALPRIWYPGDVPSNGTLLSDPDALTPAVALGRVLAANRRFFFQVDQAHENENGLTLTLEGGTELRLGAAEELPVQLAVARRVLTAVGSDVAYVDVSVPERAVVG